ncbi:MAG: hypothetical protein IBJ09_02930 [Bacteroidia bacterium]|nr:hypothetical protein [Bacteroidia bacterium]
MEITERENGRKWKADIDPVAEKDYRRITKKRYFFNWKKEQKHQVLKLSLKDKDDILGLMSLELIPAEFRIRNHCWLYLLKMLEEQASMRVLQAV